MSDPDRPQGPERTHREQSMAQTFVQLADTLVGEFDISDLFDRLTTACVDLLDAASAGLMLADRHGRLQLMASSNAAMRILELYEVSNDEGPCMDAYARHERISVDLRDAPARGRWPRFTIRALEMGFTGVQALPMRLRDNTIGALNVFHTGETRFDEHDIAIAQALADVATIAILQHRALGSSEALAEQLQTALNERIVIEQVKGLLAERGQLDIDVAFELLRDFCRSSRLPLTRTARELLTGQRDPDDVLATRWPPTPTP
ncbi:GAF domain-containing protein [uncultured Jatrophihabitans sp.]|uniref:GAF domain-containing protein n=1 Tax=uncultured Jatrophihabitans sp. TaxID=1610747 RepID=UPI0035CA5FB3